MFLVLIAVTCRTWQGIVGFPSFWFSGRESHEMQAYFLVWPEKPCFYGQAYLKTQALTRLFQATLSWQARKDLGKPGLAGLAMLLTALLMEGFISLTTRNNEG